jgi:hypothetical protein
MWMLDFIPDAYLHLAIITIICTGGGLYLLGLLMNFWPPAYPYREPVRITATVLVVAGIYFLGGYGVDMEWRAKAEQLQAKIDQASAQSESANAKIQTKIITQTKIIHDKQIVVQKEIQTVEKQIDAECKLDPAVPKILNDAAKNPMANPIGTVSVGVAK